MSSDENFFKDVREQMGYDPLRVIWHRQLVSERELFYHDSGYLTFLEEDIGYSVGRRIFEVIKDGGRYVVQAKWFKRRSNNIDTGRYMPFDGPFIEMGYEGHISQVETLRYREVNPYPLTRLIYPPPWGAILKDIMERIRKDITWPGAVRFLYRQVLARILYLPDINPGHWRIR